MLLQDHLKGQNKIQDKYKSEMFFMMSKHQDKNVYSIHPIDGKGSMCMINQRQLFDMKNFQGDTNSMEQMEY